MEACYLNKNSIQIKIVFKNEISDDITRLFIKVASVPSTYLAFCVIQWIVPTVIFLSLFFKNSSKVSPYSSDSYTYNNKNLLVFSLQTGSKIGLLCTIF